jgi:uncharacterized protein YuzE
MQITHNTQADVMYISFNDRPVHENKVLGNGLVVVDLAEDGTVVGFELISPSLYVDKLEEITYRISNDGKVPSQATE